VAPTLIKDENLEASSLAVQIVDSDDKDDSYSPSATTVKAENADGQRNRYGLRRQKESGLLIEVCKFAQSLKAYLCSFSAAP
jgi:hypothetical protein